MSRVTTENGATVKIEENTPCFATEDEAGTDVEDEVTTEELEDEFQWVGLETNSDDVLARSPEKQPTWYQSLRRNCENNSNRMNSVGRSWNL